MKKLTIICALLLTTSALFAEFDLGIKAGYTSSIGFSNFSNIGDYQWNDVKSEFGKGFHVGAFTRIGGERFYVQPELVYNMQKTDYEFSIRDGASTFDGTKYIKTSTFDVPLLLGLKLFDLKVINMRLLAGPKFRFNAGTKIEFKDQTTHAIISDISEEVKKASVGLEAGIGFDIIKRITLDVRYNLISNMSKDTKWGENVVANYNNPLNTFTVSIGFILL